MAHVNGITSNRREQRDAQISSRPPRGEEARAEWIGLQPLFPDDSLEIGGTGSSLERYSKIAVHPLVAPALQLFSDGVFWSGHEIAPSSDNDYVSNPEFRDLDTRILTSIRRQIDNLADSTFDELLRTLLHSARTWGFAVGEIVNDNHVTRSGEWSVSRFKTLLPYDFDFEVDGAGNLERVIWRGEGEREWNRRRIDRKLFIAPWPALRFGNWYGQSDLLPIIRDVQRLDLLEQFLAEGTARLSMRPILHRFDEKRSRADVEKIRAALRETRGEGLISFPGMTSGMELGAEGKQRFYDEIEVLPDRASPEGMKQGQQLAVDLRERIMRALRIPDDLGFTATSSGSRAKAGVELDIFASGVIGAQNWIKSIVDRQLIPAMTRWNWRPENLPENYHLPELTWQPLEDDFLERMSSTVIDLQTAGLISPDSARTMLELAPEEAPTEIEDGETAESAADSDDNVAKSTTRQLDMGL